MSNPILKAALLFVILLTTVSLSMAQTTSNYIFVESIFFNGERYDLAWSANPVEGYYKQEYLRGKDNLQTFNKMILIEVVENNSSLLGSIEAKVKEIIERKKHDPVANYQLLENKKTNEYLLDFVMYEDGVYEWNAYRYKEYILEDKPQEKGVLLFAFVLRGFERGEMDGNEFFNFLQNKRLETIDDVLKFDLPDIRIRR